MINPHQIDPNRARAALVEKTTPTLAQLADLREIAPRFATLKAPIQGYADALEKALRFSVRVGELWIDTMQATTGDLARSTSTVAADARRNGLPPTPAVESFTRAHWHEARRFFADAHRAEAATVATGVLEAKSAVEKQVAKLELQAALPPTLSLEDTFRAKQLQDEFSRRPLPKVAELFTAALETGSADLDFIATAAAHVAHAHLAAPDRRVLTSDQAFNASQEAANAITKLYRYYEHTRRPAELQLFSSVRTTHLQPLFLGCVGRMASDLNPAEFASTDWSDTSHQVAARWYLRVAAAISPDFTGTPGTFIARN